LRLRQLLSFVRVCELGSITRAAAELNIAQPALGLQIRSLEYEFGAELLVRNSRGVSPTASGEVILTWAREMLESTSQVRHRVKEMQGERGAPSVTIGLTPSLTVLLARPIVEGTYQSNIKVKIVEGMSQSMAEWVDNGRIDIGLGFGVLGAKGAQSVAVLRERLFYVSAAGDGDAPITLAEVLDQPLALPDEQNSIRHTIEAAARVLDMPVIGRYEVGSLQAAREIAASGKAGAITPFGGVAADRRSGDLSVRLITEPMVERTLYMMRKGTQPPTDAETTLTTVIYQALRDIAHRDEFSGAYMLLDDPRSVSNIWEEA
jgi:LysR family transcriptional regulator, nitrogen assimilation regulatory protein